MTPIASTSGPLARDRRVWTAVLTATLATTGLACEPPGGAARRATVVPDYAEATGQTKCGVVASSAKPLVVEWPAADRASLEARANRGVVVVRYSGCEMEVLPGCGANTIYDWLALTPKREVVRIADADDLYANLPIGAAKLEAKLARSGQLTVDMVIIGRKEAARDFTTADLRGDCSRATHVITGLTIGAFSFFAGAGAEIGGSLGVGSAEIGASSKHAQEVLSEDGSRAQCQAAGVPEAGPPIGCGALLRVEVARIKPAPSAASAADDDARPAAGTTTASVDVPSGGEGSTSRCPEAMVELPDPGGGASFCLDATPVTVAQYRRCVEAQACEPLAEGRASNYAAQGKARHPINFASLDDAIAFCTWAGKRVPSSAEWSWAASNGKSRTSYPWGNERPTFDQLCWDRDSGTCPVGTHPRGATSSGIHDLSGNVWEWTATEKCTAARGVRACSSSCAQTSSVAGRRSTPKRDFAARGDAFVRGQRLGHRRR